MSYQHPPKEIMLSPASGCSDCYMVLGEYPPRVIYNVTNPIYSSEGLSFYPVIKFRPDSAENRYVFNEVLPLYSSYWYLPRKRPEPIKIKKKHWWQR